MACIAVCLSCCPTGSHTKPPLFLAVAKDRASYFDRIDSNHDGFIPEQEAYDHLKAIYQANGKPMPDGLFSHLSDKS